MRILVADDQSFWRQLLREILRERGHQVICARDGAEAWRVLKSDPQVALLVTDWLMPELCGLELCRRARRLHRPSYLPIILLTSRDRQADLVSALDAGADAFVRKPFETPELLAQIRVAERILALEERLERQIEDLKIAKQRIERDLSDAASVQSSLMPTAPPDVPGVRFAWHYETCDRLGGDIFNALRLSEKQVGAYVLDVSGHGISAALHSVSLGHALQPHPQQGGVLKQIGRDGWAITPPSEVAAELNRRFPLIERSGQYFTLLYGVLEIGSHLFRYVRAGHPAPILVSHSDARWCDDGGDLPIGITDAADYSDHEIQLEPGDGLLFFTDGVTEARNADGEEFGCERLLDLVREARTRDIERIVEALRLELEKFRGPEPPRDDVTILGLRVG